MLTNTRNYYSCALRLCLGHHNVAHDLGGVVVKV